MYAGGETGEFENAAVDVARDARTETAGPACRAVQKFGRVHIGRVEKHRPMEATVVAVGGAGSSPVFACADERVRSARYVGNAAVERQKVSLRPLSKSKSRHRPPFF